MMEFHFIRPWWLLALLALAVIAMRAWKQQGQLSSWAQVCDAHLLAHLLKSDSQNGRHRAVLLICLSMLFVILSLSGPSWQRLPVPSYRQILPRVFLLDMSDSMRANDLQPSRLTRAKFKLHDAFTSQTDGQSALIAYTGEPFIVSPLTEDAKTIDALLEPLNPEIMPVQGNNLAEALQQARQLINQAGFHQGQVLVLTAQPPSNEAIAASKMLAKADIDTSILPIAKNATNPAYAKLARAGSGEVLSIHRPDDLKQWLQHSGRQVKYQLNASDLIPVWRDDGRWFLIPALLFLLPVFRRGWLQRIDA